MLPLNSLDEKTKLMVVHDICGFFINQAWMILSCKPMAAAYNHYYGTKQSPLITSLIAYFSLKMYAVRTH